MNNAYVAALSKKEVIMLIFYLGLISKHMTVKMYMYEYICSCFKR